MFNENMSINEIQNLIDTNKNEFLKELNKLITENVSNISLYFDNKKVDEEVPYPKSEFKKYFNMSYSQFSKMILSKNNIRWDSQLNKFFFIVLELPEEVGTVDNNKIDTPVIIEEKEPECSVYIGAGYTDNKASYINFSETLKEELKKFHEEYRDINKEYLTNRVIEEGLNAFRKHKKENKDNE